jgi:hypothetical protein
MSNTITQRTKILNLLLSRKGQWVPLPEVTALASQYGARVLELRRMGYTIENKKKKQADGSIHSWFSLIAEPEPVTLFAQSAIQLGNNDLIVRNFQ